MRPADLGPLPARLALGGALVCLGAPKLMSSRGRENISSQLDELGVPEPDMAGSALGLLEIASGIAIVVGARTRLASALVVAKVAATSVAAARRGGLPAALPGAQPLPDTEQNLLLGGGALTLLLTGAGRLSRDHKRKSAKRSRRK